MPERRAEIGERSEAEREDLASRLPSRLSLLLSHRLDEDPLLSLAVPLSIEHALPRTKIQPSGRDRHDHLVTNCQRAEVSSSVVLAGPTVVTVLIRRPRRDAVLEPVENIL